MIVKKAYSRLREEIWKMEHEKRCLRYRKTFQNKDISIISMNCTGGILYHDLGLQFRSPTINLFMRAEDFIKFCENLKYYLSIDEMKECKNPAIIEGRQYPIAFLGDLTLFLVHYQSVKEAQEKWNDRKKRISWNNIVILNTDREGMTNALMDRFEALPYKKAVFVHREDMEHPSAVYIKGYENQRSVGIITDHKGWRGLRPIDQFDWCSFLNKVD